jgi:hypothetical protein
MPGFSERKPGMLMKSFSARQPVVGSNCCNRQDGLHVAGTARELRHRSLNIVLCNIGALSVSANRHSYRLRWLCALRGILDSETAGSSDHGWHRTPALQQ